MAVRDLHNLTTEEALNAMLMTDVISTSFTRPNDTTAYAISDVVCNSTSAPAVMTLSNIGRELGSTGYITNVRLVKSTNVTTNASFRVYFYGTAPTPINDNAPWTLLWANRANRLGHVDFTLATEGTGSDSATDMALNVNLKFKCASDSKDIYAVLVAKAAYTPGAQEQFYLEVTAERN